LCQCRCYMGTHSTRAWCTQGYCDRYRRSMPEQYSDTKRRSIDLTRELSRSACARAISSVDCVLWRREMAPARLDHRGRYVTSIRLGRSIWTILFRCCFAIPGDTATTSGVRGGWGRRRRRLERFAIEKYIRQFSISAANTWRFFLTGLFSGDQYGLSVCSQTNQPPVAILIVQRRLKLFIGTLLELQPRRTTHATTSIYWSSPCRLEPSKRSTTPGLASHNQAWSHTVQPWSPVSIMTGSGPFLVATYCGIGYAVGARHLVVIMMMAMNPG